MHGNEIAVTFINHATALIQIPEGNILTDPIFSERASPFQWIGPKRVHKPGLTIDELPKIDVILLSHNHYDHMDLPSLQTIVAKNQHDHQISPLILVPLGNKKILTDAGLSNVVELDWWQEYQQNSLKITLTPNQHWSKRITVGRNRALWGGFVIVGKQARVYFAGDTGYSGHFKEIAQRFGPMDISLLPIGAYEPRWFMQHHHMNPAEAVRAHLDLQSHRSMAIHFGTFHLSDEAIDQPAEDLLANLKESGIPEKNFVIPRPGETIEK